MKAFITGGAGFIGSHLAATLVASGHTVTVYDDLSTGHLSNLDGLTLEFIQGDVADSHSLNQAMLNHDIVFHQAAMVSVPRSLLEPELNHRSNVRGTFNVLEAARQARIGRIVYASSAAVYGDEPSLPKSERTPIAISTPYSAAKRMGEIYATAYAQSYGLTVVGLRYMNVYGPRQDPGSPYSGVLSIFCRHALDGRPCRVYGDGEQTRDFVYVSDVVQANILAAVADLSGAPVYNIGWGKAASLNQILRLLGELTSLSLDVRYDKERRGDIRHSVSDIGLAENELGYRPRVSLLNGLEQTLDWFRSAR